MGGASLRLGSELPSFAISPLPLHASLSVELARVDAGSWTLFSDCPYCDDMKPESYDCDLFVVGAGSGGVRAARVAAGHGARVVVAESSALGGTCVNVGCVPKKLFVYASSFSQMARESAGFGWTHQAGDFDIAALVAAKDKEITRLNGIYDRLLSASGVQLEVGFAELVDAHHIRIGQKTFSAKHILLAPGGKAFVPDVPGREFAVTSTELFYLKEVPKRMLILGGGYIAVEFAGVFQGFGSQVTLAYRGDKVLRGFDEDVRDCLSEELVRSGIDVRYQADVASIAKMPGGEYVVTMKDGAVVETDLVVMATGRVPNVDGLNLGAAGVKKGPDGEILVDAQGQTNVENIYAVGDVTGRIQLTPVAIAEGHAVADSLFGDNVRAPDLVNVPSAVFSQPQVGCVGLSEQDARRTLSQVRVYRSKFRALKNTLSGKQDQTMMKLVVDGLSDRVVGCHMVGPEAGEIVQGFAVALKCGATKAQFDATIGIHPTAAEEFVTMRTAVQSGT